MTSMTVYSHCPHCHRRRSACPACHGEGYVTEHGSYPGEIPASWKCGCQECDRTGFALCRCRESENFWERISVIMPLAGVSMIVIWTLCLTAIPLFGKPHLAASVLRWELQHLIPGLIIWYLCCSVWKGSYQTSMYWFEQSGREINTFRETHSGLSYQAPAGYRCFPAFYDAWLMSSLCMLISILLVYFA